MSAFDKKTARKKKRTKKIALKLAKVDVKKSEKFVWAPLHSETFLKIILLQLNKYETAPNFNHISQNLTSDCLLI